jgi:cathepsin A (carboxypeptidase C)
MMMMMMTKLSPLLWLLWSVIPQGAAAADVVSPSHHLRTSTTQKDPSSPCNDAYDEKSCYAATDDSGEPCLWCRCQAVPSECLSPDQSKNVPPGVFDCTTPSSPDENDDDDGVLTFSFVKGVTHRLHREKVSKDLCDASSKSVSGYVDIRGSKYDTGGEDKHLFYWFFEKRSKEETTTKANKKEEEGDDDAVIPFIVWLTGGPGCSSTLALLAENGPCSVNKDGISTKVNPYSWTEAAHVLWLDQPAGVGFSYGQETDSNEEMVGEDAYYFLQAFFQANPDYVKSPLYIVGESYGGHYAPAIAHRVWKGNQHLTNSTIHLNLAGVGIGNGLTDPTEQYKVCASVCVSFFVVVVVFMSRPLMAGRCLTVSILSVAHVVLDDLYYHQWYPEMAFNNSHGIRVIDEVAYDTMKAVVPKCVDLIKECNSGDSMVNNFACQTAFVVCNMGLISPYQMTGLNPYDIRKPCEVPPLCYDFSHITKWLNLPSTRSALHVDKHSHRWESCNMGINLKFHTDWMKDFSGYVADLLNAGIPALIYAGDVDFICNYLGNRGWTLTLPWQGSADFTAATDHDWKGKGLARSAKGFTFLQVYDAGHMVPTDQPQVALDMIQTFVTGGTF